MRLSPLDPFTFVIQAAIGFAHFLAGRYDEGSSWAERAMRYRPDFLLTLAAQSMLVRSTRWSWLKAWAMQIAKRRGIKRAIVALARRLTVILHRIWVDGTDFRWTRDAAAA